MTNAMRRIIENLQAVERDLALQHRHSSNDATEMALTHVQSALRHLGVEPGSSKPRTLNDVIGRMPL